jgi:hypothetical protein
MKGSNNLALISCATRSSLSYTENAYFSCGPWTLNSACERVVPGICAETAYDFTKRERVAVRNFNEALAGHYDFLSTACLVYLGHPLVLRVPRLRSHTLLLLRGLVAAWRISQEVMTPSLRSLSFWVVS